MGRRKPREVEIEISQENYRKLQKVAKKAGLKWQEVVNMILDSEISIFNYIVLTRMVLASKLKIKSTERFLYHETIFGIRRHN